MDKEHCGYDQPGDNSNQAVPMGLPLGPASAYPAAQTSQIDSKPIDKEHYGYDQPPAYTGPNPGTVPTMDLRDLPSSSSSSSTVIVQQRPIAPPSYMWLSCLVYWFCSCLCGGIAIAFSHGSQNAADDNRMQEAKQLGQSSVGVSFTGIVCGIVMYIVLIMHWRSSQGGDSKSSHYDY